MKVKPVDPKEVEWYAYRSHFISLADEAEWADRTRATRLMGALQGSMAGATTGLPQPLTFESLLVSPMRERMHYCASSPYGWTLLTEEG